MNLDRARNVRKSTVNSFAQIFSDILAEV